MVRICPPTGQWIMTVQSHYRERSLFRNITSPAKRARVFIRWKLGFSVWSRHLTQTPLKEAPLNSYRQLLHCFFQQYEKSERAASKTGRSSLRQLLPLGLASSNCLRDCIIIDFVQAEIVVSFQTGQNASAWHEWTSHCAPGSHSHPLCLNQAPGIHSQIAFFIYLWPVFTSRKPSVYF